MDSLSYNDALEYLNSFIDYEKTADYLYNQRLLNLERMQHLLQMLGNPHQGLRIIHVAGTNGKGSTAAMIASILGKAGFRVGLYSSPHLVSFRERIRWGDEIISESDFCDLVTRLKAARPERKTSSNFESPTFFEAATALAFLFFAGKKTDFVILEVGLGGRLDATNVINKPLVCALTPIGLDHTDKLGNTLTEIAEEKTKIIKPETLVVTAPQGREALETIKRECELKKAFLLQVEEKEESGELDRKDSQTSITVQNIACSVNGSTFDISGLREDYENLHLPLRGRHQVINAATAIGAIELLRSLNTPVSPEQIRQGLSEVKWSGRLELIRTRPNILLDSAHNVPAAKRLKEALRNLFPHQRIHLILGIAADKDIRGIAAELCPLAQRVILTRAAHPRAADPHLLREKLNGFSEKAVTAPDIRTAIEEGRAGSQPDDLLCITGSFYTVGEAMEILNILQ
ncbi:MAG: bifunctional folylpolyglutamate synthase/dihydrofolate synthase [Nitrospirae bacterium]|nr:bifunctional folylpolyglutamate synthase/dihydrofolate synthase [Nitrospirota bacterium]